MTFNGRQDANFVKEYAPNVTDRFYAGTRAIFAAFKAPPKVDNSLFE